MNKIVIGILAHVDAGKTTLSEGILYLCGAIRKKGRVDNRDTFLDTFSLERERGITIFSKQAVFNMHDTKVTLLDTPGHADFSAEMERTLKVLDYAVLVINGSDGVQGHTKILWKLLKQMSVPVYIFVNKMDLDGTNRRDLLKNLKDELDENCIDFTEIDNKDAFNECLAVCDEKLLNEFIENGDICDENISDAICERKVFPCYFGSALKLTGVEEFINGMERFIKVPVYPDDFSARVYKISRDNQNNRLTHMKITGGSLKVKDTVCFDEKVNQIRVYSGDKYETVSKADAGSVVAVTGLNMTRPGQNLGSEAKQYDTFFEPVLTYNIVLPKECNITEALSGFKEIAEEIPELDIEWNEETKKIRVKIMGEVQLEVLKKIVYDRLNIDIAFDQGSIVYKETIENTVEGIGHFEPLRHYAEVHLLMEPAKPGSGIEICSDISEDELAVNWQNLILTHLMEKEHKGVLTGSAITDIKITLVAGKAHLKHTEGGDFREAVYRAVRQGLMQADSVLLEPYYSYRLEIPESVVGRAMTDIDRMSGSFEIITSDKDAAQGMAVLTGELPASTSGEYQKEVVSYTSGRGRFICNMVGYRKCHNSDEVIAEIGYNAEGDTNNPSGSIFCSHGSGYFVSWDHVKEHMHLESVLDKINEAKASEEQKCAMLQDNKNGVRKYRSVEDEPIGTDEIEAILRQTYYANSGNGDVQRKKWALHSNRRKEESTYGKEEKETSAGKTYSKQSSLQRYLLVDGYNVIFAWKELKELAQVNIDSARGRLLDILCNYQALSGYDVIVVFDAYKVKGHDTECVDYHNIHVVYTKEAETADAYIEKFAHANGRKYDVTVATSDGVEQVIIRGKGCRLISSREFEKEVMNTEEMLRSEYIDKQPKSVNSLTDNLSKRAHNELQKIRNESSDNKADN